jgi:hypothetical protein
MISPGMMMSEPDDTDARDRLMDLARGRGVSLSALSAMLGRNAAYLQQFVRKGSPRKLEENDRRTLATFFGVDERELGAPGAAKVRVVGAAALKDRGATAEWVDIPRLALGASAGPGALAGDEVAGDRLRFSQRWLRTLGLDPVQLTVIEVAGDSMEPTLRDGDEILVDRSPRPWRDGIHVVRIDDVLLVKRLEQGGGLDRRDQRQSRLSARRTRARRCDDRGPRGVEGRTDLTPCMKGPAASFKAR